MHYGRDVIQDRPNKTPFKLLKSMLYSKDIFAEKYDGPRWHLLSRSLDMKGLTLMLLGANFANTKGCKKLAHG